MPYFEPSSRRIADYNFYRNTQNLSHNDACYFTNRLPLVSQHIPVGLKQTLDPYHDGHRIKFHREYFFADLNETIKEAYTEEPVKLEAFGRFFPIPKEKFIKEQSETLYWYVLQNHGSDANPRLRYVALSLETEADANEFISRQSSRIHLRRIPQSF